MPTSLPIPSTAFTRQDIPLGSINFTFIFRFNNREKRWSFDIYSGTTPIVLGVKIVENIFLTDVYPIEDVIGGIIACVEINETDDPVGFSNIGIGKDYELLFFSTEELG